VTSAYCTFSFISVNRIIESSSKVHCCQRIIVYGIILWNIQLYIY